MGKIRIVCVDHRWFASDKTVRRWRLLLFPSAETLLATPQQYITGKWLVYVVILHAIHYCTTGPYQDSQSCSTAAGRSRTIWHTRNSA